MRPPSFNPGHLPSFVVPTGAFDGLVYLHPREFAIKKKKLMPGGWGDGHCWNWLMHYIQRFCFWRHVWVWRRQISILKILALLGRIRPARKLFTQPLAPKSHVFADCYCFLNKEYVLLYYWTCQLLFVRSNFACPPDNPFYCDCAWLWRQVRPSCKVWNENLSCCIERINDLLEKQLNTSACS